MDLLKLQTEIAEENGFDTWEQMINCFCTTDPGKRVINKNVNKLIERAVANADTGDRQLTIPDVIKCHTCLYRNYHKYSIPCSLCNNYSRYNEQV